MKAVRSIETKQVFYLFDASAALNLGDWLEAPGLIAIDINDKTHEIVDVPQPELFVSGGVLTFDTDWAVLWPQAYDDAKIVAGQQGWSASAANVRQQRNEKLSASDWTQVADAPVDQAAWAAYRQALRDITAQAGFPWTIDWPAQP